MQITSRNYVRMTNYCLLLCLLLLCPAIAVAQKDCPKAAKLLARAERYSPDDKKVLPLLEQVTSLCPDLASANYLRGVVHFENGKLEEAEAEFKKAVARGDEPRFSNGLGKVYLRKGDYNSARTQFERTLETQRDDVSALQGLSVALYGLELPAEAEQVLHRALQISPESAELFYNLAVVLEAQDKLAEANKSYKAALERQADFLEAARRSAALSLTLGEVTAADALLSPLFSGANEDSKVLVTQAAIQDAKGAHQEALTLLQQAKENGDDPIRNSFNQAIVLSKLGRSEEAEALFEKVIAKVPNAALYHSGLGWHYVRHEKWKEAQRVLLRATALDERHALSFYNLGFAYERGDDQEQALDAYRRAVELEPSNPRFKQALQRMTKKSEG